MQNTNPEWGTVMTVWTDNSGKKQYTRGVDPMSRLVRQEHDNEPVVEENSR